MTPTPVPTRTIAGPRPLRGRIRVPGDKSISHRALLFGALATGESRIRGLATGDDVARTRAAVEALGVTVEGAATGEVLVRGRGWSGLRAAAEPIDCGNSGTTIRILCGVVAGRPFTTTLTGDPSIQRRPMARVVDPLREMGCVIDGRDGGAHAPLVIQGGGLRGIRYELPLASAQVKSALILAGLQADGPTEIVEVHGLTRDHTERMLRAAGVTIAVDGDLVRVEPGDVGALDLDVPGDPSSAAFFIVGALVTPDSEIVVERVALNPRRIGFVDVLRRMGADVEVTVTGEEGGEPVGEIRAATSMLEGTRIAGEEIPRVIDEIPALAVAAAWADGETEIRDASELAVKESNRIGSIEQELSQMGVSVRARRDGLTIRGGHPRPGQFKSHGDHRIAMMTAIAANACAGASELRGIKSVSVSYPEFFADLERVTPGDGDRA